MINFNWRVPLAGFAWRKTVGSPHKNTHGKPTLHPAIAGAVAPGNYLIEESPFRVYDPFTHTGLFRTFAAVEPTPAGVLAFADEFGLLGIGMPVNWPLRSKTWIDGGESFESWPQEITAMRQAVELFDRSGASDDLLLGINRKLGQLVCHPQLAWEKTSRKGRQLQLVIKPTNLLAMLWTQLGKAIEGNRAYAQCDQCHAWYEISAGKREAVKFCGNACRFKAYRNRQKEAVRLRTGGMQPREIAKQLNSKAETVKGWIKKGLGA